ncbi:MAG TPA: hypothetical protein VMM92_06190 [Thermoanaerobaculia bacterium]|nr:hypothetical protein [Thermoanaerobaculia bacterium]
MEEREVLSEIANSEKEISEGFEKISNEFEWKQFLGTLTRSSDRGRYLMVLVVFSTLFCMICWLNSRDESWIAGRVVHARQAIYYETWEANSRFRTRQDFAETKAWAESYNLYTKELLLSYLARLEEMETQNAYSARIPVVGIAFDINDLGAIAGLSFLFLMLVLLASTYREHENLYLCLWRVKKTFLDEKRLDHGRSAANLLYHSLAMAQVFSNPPTLGRWQRSRMYYLPYIIFFLPALPETLILFNDLSTAYRAEALSRPATYVSIAIQILCLVLGLIISVFCLLYERSADKRWRATFEFINPRYAHLEQPPLRDWLLLSGSRPRKMQHAEDTWLVSPDQKKVRLSAKAKEGRIALIFDDDRLPQWREHELQQKLDRHAVNGNRLRIAVNGKLKDDRHFRAGRRFLSRWRAREVAFVVLDPDLQIQHVEGRWAVPSRSDAEP